MTINRKFVNFVKRKNDAVSFKKNVQVLLPYKRIQYITYINGNILPRTKWYGVSFQLSSEEHNISRGVNFGLLKFIENYEALFKKVISEFDNGSWWIITHDKYDDFWLPNNDRTLPRLRALFVQHHIPNKFKGAILLKKSKLFSLANEILSYPSGIFSREKTMYTDLDISHNKLPLVIKISSHLNVDFLSTNKEILQHIVNTNHSSLFNIKQNNGTSLISS